MKIFLDTADLKKIKEYLDMGIIDGVTTNPTIMSQFHTSNQELVKAIWPRPLSLEVATNDIEEMREQAVKLSEEGANVVVKIPVENEFGTPCLGLIKELEKRQIKVNATVCLSFSQVMLAAKVNATYTSLFAGRVGDEGGDSSEVIADCVGWLKRWHYASRLIIGSIRSVEDVNRAAKAGAHIITIPPAILDKMFNHYYTRATVHQFIEDSKK
jgi:transaldolase